MTADVISLAKLGWHVTDAGLKKLSGGKELSENEIIKLAQDTDIKDYGKGHIPENWSKKDMVTIEGVLQVQKVRNVAAPKANEESQGAPRLLRVTLSDGANTVMALEAGQPWSRLSLRTPPGAKVRLRQAVPVCCGFLLVPDSALQLIGGSVQLMVDKWLMAKAFASQNLRPATGAAGGPPPWVPFGKNISAVHKAERDFKSLAGGEEAPVDAEFEAQRQAQIAQLTNTGRKQFGGGTKQMTDGNLQTLMGAGFTQEESEAALKYTYNDVGRALQNLQRFRARREGREGADGDTGRGRGRAGGRGRGGGRRGRYEEEEEASSRPSEPVTLLDFVGLKIGADTGASDGQPALSPDDYSSSAPSAPAGRRQDYDRGDRSGGSYGTRGGRGGYGGYGDRGRGRGDFGGDRGSYGRNRDGEGYGRDRDGGGYDGQSDGRGRGGRGRGGYGDVNGGYNRGGRGGGDRGRGLGDRGRGGRGSQRQHISSDEFVEGRRARERRRAAGGDYDGGGGGGFGGGRGGGARWSGGGGGSSGGFDGYADDRQQFPDLPGAGTAGGEGQGGAGRNQGTERRAPPAPAPAAATAAAAAAPAATAAAAQHLYTEGEMCLARYWEDKQLYLARVISIGDRTAVVNFVDYGEHYEEVLTSNMRPLGFEEEEKEPAHREEPARQEKPRPREEPRRPGVQNNDYEDSDTSSLFIHNRRANSRQGQADQDGYGAEPQRHNGTQDGHDGGDTYRNDRGDTYRNDRGDNYRSSFRGGSSDRGARDGRGRGGRGQGYYEGRPPRHQNQDRDRNHSYNYDRPPRHQQQDRGNPNYGDRPPRHQYQDRVRHDDYSGEDRPQGQRYQDRGRGQRQFDDRPQRGGYRGGGGGGRGRGRYEENGPGSGDGGGQREQRQWMDTAPPGRGRGRGRGQPQESSDDTPFARTMEFRRGGRRPFVPRGGGRGS